jgi:hypothetical protein
MVCNRIVYDILRVFYSRAITRLDRVVQATKAQRAGFGTKVDITDRAEGDQ